MRYFLIACITTIVVAIDQYTKALTVASIKMSESIPVTSFFNLVHVRNRGAAFGFLNNSDTTWQLTFFLGVTVIALGVILYLARSASPKQYFFFIALGFISGGGVGNAIDRIVKASVVDFLDVHVGNWHWPAFNVADMAICFGAFCLFFFMFKANKTQQTKERFV